MRPLPPVRLGVAAVTLAVASFTASLPAQTQRTELIAQVALENAEAFLPNAPVPQASDPSAPPPATGQAAEPAASQSSSQPAGSGAPQNGTETAADAKKKEREQAEQQLKAEEKQRLLGVMPQFQVVNGQAVPLSGGEKWRLALHSAVDPFYIGWAVVIGGGFGEIVGSHDGYGWGDKGYLKRVGANYADNVNGALIGNALLPQLLHQDPRYFRLGTGSFGRRFAHAALSTIVCKGDNGKNQPNVSNVLGNYISGAISNSYYPADERGVALTLENGTSVTLFGALGGQLLEFGPDLARLLHRKKSPAPVAPTSIAAPPPNSPASAPKQSPPTNVPSASH